MTRAILSALLLVAAPLFAGEEARAPTFVGAYTWQQVMWQWVDDGEGRHNLERGDFLGGRLVGGYGIGRLGLEMRVDVAGLEEQFVPTDPKTYATIEGYAAVHLVAFQRQGVQLGPIAVAGTVAGSRYQGLGWNFRGGGVRFAGGGAEIEVLYARHDYLPAAGWRVSVSAHVPLKGPLYGVGDVVGGADGYVRVGLAIRVK